MVSGGLSQGDEGKGASVFSRDDLGTLSGLVASAWRQGFDRDWSVPAGTLEWSCTKTADHAVDAVLAPAFFLASRAQRDPDFGWGPQSIGPEARPEQLVLALETATRVLSAVIADAPPGTKAFIRRRPEAQVAGPEDFAPRGGLELILHAHDVCSGLRVSFEPYPDLCGRLREHTRSWPTWGISQPSWSELPKTDDPWGDLLQASGRQRALPNP
jgi:hypothetical protein